MTGAIVIAAGGTGGHFFPAEALGAELLSRGHRLVLMTDRRGGQRETGVFARGPQHVLPGAGIAGRGIAARARNLAAIGTGVLEARRLLSRIDAAAVVGFGGYPSVPPLVAARSLGRRRPAVVLHEGNAVLGLANAQLARFADAVATSYPDTARLPMGAEVTVTGMPVRPDIAALAGRPYEAPGEIINLLIWGGSLGAKVFSDIMPDVLQRFEPGLRARLRITQQARAEDVERVRAAYAQAGIPAEVAPFLYDIPRRLAEAHLVIGRAGGSSVAEITVAGRPALLVPLPIAASDEQTANATALVAAGGGWLVTQPHFNSVGLSALLPTLLTDPLALPSAAAASARLGRPDAARLLADLVESRLRRKATSAIPPSSAPETRA
ncbi:UDP-N-acetylglucosamine--N-acetylmuramyl-(pentapeptide) pyrophosphoryl-undecaprenol N-acetylglucosamine transferase [Lichenicoccus roseus]|uniref:UDP-N-acetylglucosamine--N-acetylmuramyl-(pentapeptide) pyrophosphoryl-undecaprenol N-acetylglucosamine transferase n=1 Tax=Lichenicoccus roseus TaxID=2683649 RepID=A0A5R9JGT6_9PROT|nr:UDP-N-acetylglucosamine--N-acetylmuramyl-(pentapeptide) pyrophosphoryl-undecaprenol N-acetylglucosamine transferase [Lichenicoccus roseus]TLU73508.1 UDP-N-acetylglucosamine--N-acetylmuramyl-(pentapeptide) pyrophosphoryl-undecaprenol N-acetylglucosamine transferase [Lichenicoccus roseus]